MDASRQSFTPATAVTRKLTYRKIRRADRLEAEVKAQAKAKAMVGAEEARDTSWTLASASPRKCRMEHFPTGLVMSKHFREACTGREILMLEIEKVGQQKQGGLRACLAKFNGSGGTSPMGRFG